MKTTVSITLDIGLSKQETLLFVEHCFSSGAINIRKGDYILEQLPSLKSIHKFTGQYSAEEVTEKLTLLKRISKFLRIK